MWLIPTWLSEWHCSAVWGYPDTADGVAAGGRARPSADQEAQRDGADVEERGWAGKSGQGYEGPTTWRWPILIVKEFMVIKLRSILWHLHGDPVLTSHHHA